MAMPEGTTTFTSLVVDQTVHETDMCVSDLSVTVDIDHPCIDQLHLTLYGPGPPTGARSQFENTARAEPAVLFTGFSDATGGDFSHEESGSDGRCIDGMDASFSDSAESSAWECCGGGR